MIRVIGGSTLSQNNLKDSSVTMQVSLCKCDVCNLHDLSNDTMLACRLMQPVQHLASFLSFELGTLFCM